VTIPAEARHAPGRALAYYGDVSWGRQVREGKYVIGRYGEELVQAAADLIRDRWRPEPGPEWVTAVPSRRHPQLVSDFAERLAGHLNLPFVPALTCLCDAPEQKTMANSAMQARNVKASLGVGPGIRHGPVLLVDDIIDSGWTMTVAGWLLRTHGSGPVHPFALARATPGTS
jgi:ATP-dependent DNA helicase RecQ